MGNRVVQRLFARLGAEFGHKFTSAMATPEAAEAAEAVWAERLAGLSLAEMKRGVESLPKYARNHDGWPPGASEFRELCRPHREPYERVEFQGRALPLKPATPETARKYLDQLRGITTNGDAGADTGADRARADRAGAAGEGRNVAADADAHAGTGGAGDGVRQVRPEDEADENPVGNAGRAVRLAAPTERRGGD